MTHERLTYLLDQFAGKRLTELEDAELRQFLDGVAAGGLPEELLQPVLAERAVVSPDYMTEGEHEQLLQAVFAVDKRASGVARPVHRMHFLRRWGWAAAAIILVIGTVVGIKLAGDRGTGKTGGDVVKVAVKEDIGPGSSKAVLTLSNGRRVELDSTAGVMIDDDGLAIRNKDGGLIYGKEGAEVTNKKDGPAEMNTMTTPNGGQYQLTLTDGTRVWLNAASSITYPTAFKGVDRRVTITGEAYFEVAKDGARPFWVDVAGKSRVEVLGTSFNVNSYTDEGPMRTTLLYGKVRVGTVVLQPGQQAVQADSTGQVVVNSGVDVAQTIAWKNGLFNFNGLRVREVLNQLARWYDIKVQMQGKEPDFHFMGKMYRNADLSEVLKMLRKMELKFRMEGKTLIVL